jgi:hypothetical protein
MHLDEIREIVKAHPFKTFEIHVDNGEKYIIKHPENIFITPHLIITVDEQEKTIIIAPEAISTLCFFDGQHK